MKNPLFLTLLVIIAFAGCKKNIGGSSSTYGSGQIALVSGDAQSGVFGELLENDIVLKVTSSIARNRFKVFYRAVQGNGSMEMGSLTLLEPTTVETPGDEIIMKWRLGCDNTVQKMIFYVYTDSLLPDNIGYNNIFYHQPSDSLVVTANAEKPSGWCKSCGFGQLEYLDIFPGPGSKLYLINKGLFSSSDGGFNWYKMEGIPFSEEIMHGAFNALNELFVATKSHGVYYTNNMHDWTAISSGLILSDPTSFYADDSTLIISDYNGLYTSTNKGGSWKKAVFTSVSEPFYFINRHPNGSLMLFDGWNNLQISDDNGKNWREQFLGNQYRPGEVYDFKIDPLGVLYIGADNASIAAVNISNFEGVHHSHYEWNGGNQGVNNIVFSNGDALYLVHYTPSPGIYSKNNNWSKIDVGFNEQISYFYPKPNDKFLIGSEGFLYYRD